MNKKNVKISKTVRDSNQFLTAKGLVLGGVYFVLSV
jgi:hypothetical protein